MTIYDEKFHVGDAVMHGPDCYRSRDLAAGVIVCVKPKRPGYEWALPSYVVLWDTGTITEVWYTRHIRKIC